MALFVVLSLAMSLCVISVAVWIAIWLLNKLLIILDGSYDRSHRQPSVKESLLRLK
eukprot:CAMPEP_0201536646 /NCGR_PEP_ID=MMETSP0161_2-20130828/62473_1 /ASSEMBLY_ACC=CAM_ASM_000251 /TAXON_ID=180227 /ORGANISM="Neoparamoeba aestuarina, Strain SoJaBio B1-5/56/2" /LENGTH=55 /DNA_ID=CAMNT_0047942483 /DNA_START=122 /DNA_END=286 /DNA_ORIENTATION=+